jgi:hypothetical protein
MVAATQKRKIDLQGTGDDKIGPKASRILVEELTGTCAGPEEVMSSPELQETSSRMLKVTGDRWHRKYPIPLCRCFGSDRTPGVAPRGVFRNRTVSTTVAKWFVSIARGTVDRVYRFGPLRDA